uniref:Uncharacterized protein n=1 Tax=Tanacetum cinerariifolium TaxID=118510 RepID=A0A699GT99_TANCI|nr:hypothetical protein [Tanacetum cinerariifolium]
MFEFDGSTTIRKDFVKADGFVIYPFQLVDFDGIEPSNKKYLIGVAIYMNNVGRTNHQKTGSRNLDFYLANHRGQSIMVTLWGGLGDVLIEKKTKQNSGVESKNPSLPVDHSQPTEGTCNTPTKAETRGMTEGLIVITQGNQ